MKVFILVYQVFRDFIARSKQIELTCEHQRVIGNTKKNYCVIKYFMTGLIILGKSLHQSGVD